MSKSRFPMTPAVRVLRSRGVDFSVHTYRYAERGGARAAAAALGVSLHAVVKTIVLETPQGAPLLVLMHGDREVSAKMLARTLGVRHVQPCDPRRARKITGYTVGGISPFGVDTPMTVYVQASVLALKTLYINGGKRGFLLGIEPTVITTLLDAVPVDVAVDKVGPSPS